MSDEAFLFDIPPGTFLANQQIPDIVNGGYHPHAVDFYIPNPSVTSPFATQRAIVCLHGGSGSKEKFAANLGLTTSLTATVDNINWPLISYWNVIVVVVQGQACIGNVNAYNPTGIDTRSSTNPDGVRTWGNHVMLSGADDMGMLASLSYLLTNNYGLPKNKITLAGHSNGGMMAHRKWREAPNDFTTYCSCSGPASDYYLSHTALPTNLYQFYQEFGGQDTVLDITGGPAGPGNHFQDALLIQNPAQLSKADVAFPNATQWIGPWVYLQTLVTAFGGGTINYSDGVVVDLAATVQGTGTQTTWTYAGGDVVLRLYSAASHQIWSHEQVCHDRLFGRWMKFSRGISF